MLQKFVWSSSFYFMENVFCIVCYEEGSVAANQILGPYKRVKIRKYVFFNFAQYFE